MAYDWNGEPHAREATDRDFPDSSQALYSVLACSRLRDSGESVNSEKERQKKSEGAGERQGGRSRASYFRVPFLIFVPSQLSESLEQANSVLELLAAYSSPVYLNGPTLHRFCSQSHIHDGKFQPRPIWEGARKYCFTRYSVLKKNSYFNVTHFLQRYYLNTNS